MKKYFVSYARRLIAGSTSIYAPQITFGNELITNEHPLEWEKRMNNHATSVSYPDMNMAAYEVYYYTLMFWTEIIEEL